jgi:hypothetical protein
MKTVAKFGKKGTDPPRCGQTPKEEALPFVVIG